MSGKIPAAGLAGILLIAGCTALAPVPKLSPDELQWPPSSPRVRLEKVIASRRDVAGRSFLRWLGGSDDPALFVRPYGVAWDGDDLVVTDPGAGRVVRLGLASRKIAHSPSDLMVSPIGVAVCGRRVVVSDSRGGQVAILNPQLHLERWLHRELDRPTGVACLGQRIAVVETGRHRVVLLAAGGELEVLGGRGEATSEFNFPTAAAVGDGILWVGDTLNFRVQRFAADSGEYVGSFGQLGDAAGEMPRLKGLAVDRDGHLWISDAHLDQVALFDPEGGFLMDLGRSGSAAGEFSFPAGIAAHPDGRVAVVDSLNRRIQIFRVLAAEENHLQQDDPR